MPRTPTTVVPIDPALLERAVRLSGERTRVAAVARTLREFIARRDPQRVVELVGKLRWDATFDPKAERSRRR